MKHLRAAVAILSIIGTITVSAAPAPQRWTAASTIRSGKISATTQRGGAVDDLVRMIRRAAAAMGNLVHSQEDAVVPPRP